MTTYDDPNRQAVGLAPIWTGADAQPEPHSAPSGKSKKATTEVVVTSMEDNAEA